jgi:hypothetical protein
MDHLPFIAILLLRLLLLFLSSVTLCISPLCAVLAVQEDGSSVNVSSLTWPVNFADSFQSLQTSEAGVEDEDPLGGFDSLDSMLQWAIGKICPSHSPTASIS